MPATVGVTVSLLLSCTTVASPPEVLVNVYLRFVEMGLSATAVRVTESPTFSHANEAVSEALSATGSESK